MPSNGIPSIVGSTYFAISVSAATHGGLNCNTSPRIDIKTPNSSSPNQPSKTFDLAFVVGRHSASAHGT